MRMFYSLFRIRVSGMSKDGIPAMENRLERTLHYGWFGYWKPQLNPPTVFRRCLDNIYHISGAAW